jgi:hypothetical protein
MNTPRVFVVEWGNEFPAEVDSVWATQEEAQRRADELNERAIRGGDNYRVSEWSVRDKWKPGE